MKSLCWPAITFTLMNLLSISSVHADLFSSDAPIYFEVEYNAAKLKEMKLLASAQGNDQRDTQQVKLRIDGQEIEGQLSVKGLSSPSELDFPKLKISFEKGTGTILAQNKELSIQTHGYDQDFENAWTPLGRLHNSKWVYREAGLYHLLAYLNFPVRHVRLASITYINESDTLKDKPALLLERITDFAKSLGGEKIKNAPLSYPGDLTMDVKKRIKADVQSGLLDLSDVALAKLAHVMVGNDDFDFPTDITDDLSVQNFSLMKIPSTDNREKIVVSPEDFDMATAVTGLAKSAKHCEIPKKIRALQNDMANKVWCSLEWVCPSHRPADMRSAFSKSLAMEPKALSFEDSAVDPEGRSLLQAQLKAYFAVIKLIKVTGKIKANCS